MNSPQQDERSSESEELKKALLHVASELEYEKNYALFLGYKVDEIAPNVISLTPDNSDRLWWWWLIKRSHGLLARRAMLSPKPAASRIDCLEFVNLVNCHYEVVSLTLEPGKDGGLEIFAQSFLEGEYNRANFTIFIERINQELSSSLGGEEVLEIWRRIGPARDGES